jgi:pyochelin biosynthesis protein PchC
MRTSPNGMGTVSSSATSRDAWIRRFASSRENAVRLICFPHAGGSATYYAWLSRSLAPEIELLAIQYPGRQDRRLEKCVDNITELSDRIFETLGPWTNRPYAFFGHSMGAIVAFEVARRFQATMNTGPLRLFASGRRAPSRQRNGNVHQRDDRGLIAELRRVGATDDRVLADQELLATILPVTRADYKAIETYACAPGSVVDCPVTALVGDADPQTTIEEASAWAEHCTEEFDLRIFPGGHFFFNERQTEITELISASLSTTELYANSPERNAF